jgi:hypothetical protein
MDRTYLNSFAVSLVFFAICCGFGQAPAVVAQQPKTAGKLASLVVLKNNNVLEGIVRADFEKTLVETLSGSRIVVPTEQVAMVCENYNEAFEFLWSQIDGEDFARQAELVPWCIRFKQFEQAQRLIDRLQFTKINPQVLDDLSRQLVSARERAEKTQLAQSTPPQQHAGNAQNLPANSQTGRDQINVVDPMIQKANFETIELDVPKATAAPESSLTTVPIHTLEKALDQVPEFGRSSFKRVVEPILVKNCAAAGCHNRQQKNMPLLELGHGLSVPKRLSQQNLYQVMHFVGDGQPQNSVLIQQALTAHGTQKQASIKPNSREHLILQEWITLMAEPVRTTQIPQAKTSLADVAPTDSQEPEASAAVPRVAQRPVETRVNANAPTIPDLRKRKQDQVPADAFDPEIFNRQFLQKPDPTPKKANDPTT